MIRICSALLLAFLAAGPAAGGEAMVDRPDWGRHFRQFGATGTLVIVDERRNGAATFVHDRERAQRRYAPASTYKIPHTLFALDAGVVADEFQVFAWDGARHDFAGHEQDQTLRSAMRYSTLWVYEGFARQIGQARARDYLRRIDYGNADPSTRGGAYWVDGDLRISAVEQVAFLRRLYRNALPFAVEHQRLVKDLIVRQATSRWILRAKTGWEGRYGWWVGWVETADGAIFFALNIDTPGRLADLPKREQVVRAVLRSLGTLEPD